MIMKNERDLPEDENMDANNDQNTADQETENHDLFSENKHDNLSSTHNSKDNLGEFVDEEQSQISRLNDKIKELKQNSEKSQTRLRYLLADFDNYRKQAEKQMEARIEVVRADLLEKLIKIEDDYERAIDTIAENSCDPSIMEGMQGILKNIQSLLKSEGVLEIEALGTPFDPSVHDAVSYKPSENEQDNLVVEVVRKGFMLNNKVLRPSLVILSKKIISNKDTNQSERSNE
jgi:molecular chaperone GrpE